MKAVLTKVEDNKAFFDIEIEQSRFEEAIQNAYLKNRNRFAIPGFRKGRVPRKIIEMNYGESVFYEEALNTILPEVYEEAIEELELETVDLPDVDIKQMEKDKPLIFEVEVFIKPEVKLGDYEGVEIEKVEYPVSDEDVEKELKAVQEMNGRIIDAGDRETKDGDILTIDFKGFMNGEQFEGGTAEKHELELGSNTFIPGFEEQLIGKKRNENVEVKVDFPEDYFEESFQNKEAIFEVFIHDIKEKELPILDDEFAKDVSEYDTLEEYRGSIRAELEKAAKDREKIELENNIIDKIVESSEMQIPDVMIEHQLENEINQFNYRLELQGLNVEQYLKLANTDMDELKEQLYPMARKNVETDLVLEALAKEKGLEVEDEDIDKELEKLAKEYRHEDVEQFKENMKKGDLGHIKSGIMRDKTIEILLNNAKIS